MTACYLVGMGAFGMLIDEAFGRDGFTLAQFTKGLILAVIMSPLLHPAYAARLKSVTGPGARFDEPADRE